MSQDLGKTAVGLEPKIASLLAYLPFLGWIIALVFFLLEKENKFLRFNCLQSLFFTAAAIVLSIAASIIPFLNVILIPLVSLACFALSIVLMVKSYTGEKLKLPFIGDIAEKNA